MSIYIRHYFNDTHGKNEVFINSVKEFIGIEAWLFVAFFLRSHNQI